MINIGTRPLQLGYEINFDLPAPGMTLSNQNSSVVMIFLAVWIFVSALYLLVS